MDSIGWAFEEFGEAMLGDPRRTDRLVKVASRIVRCPEASLSNMLGSEADNKGAQRFFSNNSFDFNDIAESSVEKTLKRINGSDRAILIQDTSHLNYDSRKGTLGLGHIGSTAKKNFQGIMMHWTLALNGEGEALGLCHLNLWERAKNPKKKGINAHQNRPIEKKESRKWQDSVEAIADNLSPDTQKIWVTDREGDIYDFIDTILSKGHDFVIRSNPDRVISDSEGLLKERVRSAPVVGTQMLNLRKPIDDIDQIEVEIRCCDAEIVAQRRKGGAKSPRLCADHEIFVVCVSAKNLAFDAEWILLTSLRLEDLADCLEVIWIYKQRWHIESIHKTLKSGFKAEDITLNHAEKIKKAIAIMLPCAIQVYWMAHQQKHHPNELASSILSKTECTLLSLRSGQKPSYVPTIKEAWLWIGRMGGFRGGKNSAPPGQITFWRGLRELKNMAAGAELIQGL